MISQSGYKLGGTARMWQHRGAAKSLDIGPEGSVPVTPPLGRSVGTHFTPQTWDDRAPSHECLAPRRAPLSPPSLRLPSTLPLRFSRGLGFHQLLRNKLPISVTVLFPQGPGPVSHPRLHPFPPPTASSPVPGTTVLTHL